MGMINSSKFLIGGHRGSPKKKRENTLESFKQAIDDGADFIEFDIRSGGNGKLIIHHDPISTDSLLNPASYKIPTLRETLELCKDKIMLDAEIKEPHITENAVREILEFFDPDDFIVTSFFDNAVKIVKENFPNVTTGLLFDKETSTDIEKRVSELKPNLLLPHYTIFEKYEMLYLEAGLKTILWTVNKDYDVRRFKEDERVLGTISDYPEKALIYSS